MTVKDKAQDELTLRDYFAAKALQGQAGLGGAPHTQAKWAYELADAMLAEREKKTPAPAPELWVFTFDNGVTEWTQNPEQAEQIKRHLRESETVTEYVKIKGT
jgi:hypothetical protein